MDTFNDVWNAVTDSGIEFVLAQFADLNARSSAKLVPVDHLKDLFSDGVGFAGFAAGDLGQAPNSPDLIALPDARSFTPVPWQSTLGWVACNLWADGKQWMYDPRTILERELETAARQGFRFMIGAEVEFSLLKKIAGRFRIADSLDVAKRPAYDINALTRNYEFMSTLARYENDLDWDNYASDHEDANGQYESNFGFTDALTTSDRVMFFRYMVRTMAQTRGLFASFMPKPFAQLTGNGCHFHLSLWNDAGRENLFLDNRDLHGLSDLGRHFIAGLEAHAPAYVAITAPTVNSYKRLAAGSPASGSTWTPIRIGHGYDRTQMLRIPAPGRVEDRTVDGACSPYLAATAILAAGMDGIRNELVSDNHDESLPANLLDAVRNLERDDVLREALGNDFTDYYAFVKKREWQDYHETVSDWERSRYL